MSIELEYLRILCREAQGLDGAMAEIGEPGEASIAMAGVFEDKMVYSFDDTFIGTSYSEAKKAMRPYKNLCLLPHIFPEAASWYKLPSEYCFVRVDIGGKPVVSAALDYFWPRMVPGGIILLQNWEGNPALGWPQDIFPDWETSLILRKGP